MNYEGIYKDKGRGMLQGWLNVRENYDWLFQLSTKLAGSHDRYLCVLTFMTKHWIQSFDQFAKMFDKLNLFIIYFILL